MGYLGCTHSAAIVTVVRLDWWVTISMLIVHARCSNLVLLRDPVIVEFVEETGVISVNELWTNNNINLTPGSESNFPTLRQSYACSKNYLRLARTCEGRSENSRATHLLCFVHAHRCRKFLLQTLHTLLHASKACNFAWNACLQRAGEEEWKESFQSCPLFLVALYLPCSVLF